MLVLSRKIGESIKLADDIEITILAIDSQRVRLGIRAPREIPVRRTGGPGEALAELPVEEANRQAALDGQSAQLDHKLLRKAAQAKNPLP